MIFFNTETKPKKMFLKLFIITSVLVVSALIAMGIKILLRKGSGFPEMHIGRSMEMQKRGIVCAKQTDVGCSPAAENECVACRDNSGRR